MAAIFLLRIDMKYQNGGIVPKKNSNTISPYMVKQTICDKCHSLIRFEKVITINIGEIILCGKCGKEYKEAMCGSQI